MDEKLPDSLTQLKNNHSAIPGTFHFCAERACENKYLWISQSAKYKLHGYRPLKSSWIKISPSVRPDISLTPSPAPANFQEQGRNLFFICQNYSCYRSKNKCCSRASCVLACCEKVPSSGGFEEDYRLKALQVKMAAFGLIELLVLLWIWPFVSVNSLMS